MKALIFAFFTVLCANVYAQIPATTEDGRKVNLNDDGTWAFVDGDSVAVEEKKECVCKYPFFVNDRDEFSTNANVRLKPVKIATSSRGKRLDAYVSFKGSKKSDIYSVYLNFYENLGCMNAGAYATFKFEDGSMLKLDHTGELDCASPMLFKSDVSNEIDRFRRLKVTTIRMQGTEYYSDIELDNTEFFMDAFNGCIFESFPEEE